MKFDLTEVYGCSREQYLIITGISSEEMLRHLESETIVLRDNLKKIRDEYRIGGRFTDTTQRYRAELMRHITQKIESKEAKIKDIKNNMIGGTNGSSR
jgi:hypothetical protein